jgi:hypothetical protein
MANGNSGAATTLTLDQFLAGVGKWHDVGSGTDAYAASKEIARLFGGSLPRRALSVLKIYLNESMGAAANLTTRVSPYMTKGDIERKLSESGKVGLSVDDVVQETYPTKSGQYSWKKTTTSSGEEKFYLEHWVDPRWQIPSAEPFFEWKCAHEAADKNTNAQSKAIARLFGGSGLEGAWYRFRIGLAETGSVDAVNVAFRVSPYMTKEQMRGVLIQGGEDGSVNTPYTNVDAVLSLEFVTSKGKFYWMKQVNHTTGQERFCLKYWVNPDCT